MKLWWNYKINIGKPQNKYLFPYNCFAPMLKREINVRLEFQFKDFDFFEWMLLRDNTKFYLCTQRDDIVVY